MKRLVMVLSLVSVGCGAASSPSPSGPGRSENDVAMRGEHAEDPAAPVGDATLGPWATHADWENRGDARWISAFAILDGEPAFSVGGSIGWLLRPNEPREPLGGLYGDMVSSGGGRLSVADCDATVGHQGCTLRAGRRGALTPVATVPLSSARHALVAGDGFLAVVHGNPERLSLTRVRESGPPETLVLSEAPHWIVDAAIGEAGIFALAARGAFLVRGREVEDVLPDQGQGQAIASCRGEVWAVFELPSGEAAGPWTGDGWDLTPLPSTYVGQAQLAFDERCRPFASVANEVFSRRAGAWVLESALGGNVSAMLVHDGSLYAAHRPPDRLVIGRAPIVEWAGTTTE